MLFRHFVPPSKEPSRSQLRSYQEPVIKNILVNIILNSSIVFVHLNLTLMPLSQMAQPGVKTSLWYCHSVLEAAGGLLLKEVRSARCFDTASLIHITQTG